MPPKMENIATKYPFIDAVRFSMNCDECSALTTDEHYHCNVCNLSDLISVALVSGRVLDWLLCSAASSIEMCGQEWVSC